MLIQIYLGLSGDIMGNQSWCSSISQGKEGQDSAMVGYSSHFRGGCGTAGVGVLLLKPSSSALSCFPPSLPLLLLRAPPQ